MSSCTLDEIKEMLLMLNKNIEKMHDKLDILCNNSKLHEEVFSECKKMGSHIDFIESVYDNMKHPLNYLCGTINTISNNSNNKTICNESA